MASPTFVAHPNIDAYEIWSHASLAHFAYLTCFLFSSNMFHLVCQKYFHVYYYQYCCVCHYVINEPNSWVDSVNCWLMIEWYTQTNNVHMQCIILTNDVLNNDNKNYRMHFSLFCLLRPSGLVFFFLCHFPIFSFKGVMIHSNSTSSYCNWCNPWIFYYIL